MHVSFHRISSTGQQPGDVVETGRFDIWMSCFFPKTYVNQKIGPLFSCPKNFTNKDPKTPLFLCHWHVNWGAKLERLSERWSCYPGAWDADTYSKRPAERKWFYLKGCCETKSTSTFFVIAVKEVSKNDGNGILKITIVGLTSKILQNGAGVQVVRTSLLGSCSDSFSQHLRCGIAMPSQELIQNVGFTTKRRTMMGGVSCVCVVLGHAWASCYLIFWSSYRVASPIRATELGQKMQNKQNKQWTNLLDDTCLPRPNFQNFKVLNGIEGYVIRTIAWFQRIP